MKNVNYFVAQTDRGHVFALLRRTIDTVAETYDLDRSVNGIWVSEPDWIGKLTESYIDEVTPDTATRLALELSKRPGGGR